MNTRHDCIKPDLLFNSGSDKLAFNSAVGIVYSESNAASLKEFLLHMKPHHINSFKGGTVNIIKLDAPLMVYRTGEIGKFWTITPPNSPWQHCLEMAMHPSLYPIDQREIANFHPANKGVLIYKIPRGVTIGIGHCAPQGGFPGMGVQVFLPEVKCEQVCTISWEQWKLNQQSPLVSTPPTVDMPAAKLPVKSGSTPLESTAIPWRSGISDTRIVPFYQQINYPALGNVLLISLGTGLTIWDGYNRLQCDRAAFPTYNEKDHYAAAGTSISLDISAYTLLARLTTSSISMLVVGCANFMSEVAHASRDIAPVEMANNRDFLLAAINDYELSPDAAKILLDDYDRGGTMSRNFNIAAAQVTKISLKPFLFYHDCKQAVVDEARNLSHVSTPPVASPQKPEHDSSAEMPLVVEKEVKTSSLLPGFTHHPESSSDPVFQSYSSTAISLPDTISIPSGISGTHLIHSTPIIYDPIKLESVQFGQMPNGGSGIIINYTGGHVLSAGVKITGTSLALMASLDIELNAALAESLMVLLNAAWPYALPIVAIAAGFIIYEYSKQNKAEKNMRHIKRHISETNDDVKRFLNQLNKEMTKLQPLLLSNPKEYKRQIDAYQRKALNNVLRKLEHRIEFSYHQRVQGVSNWMSLTHCQLRQVVTDYQFNLHNLMLMTKVEKKVSEMIDGMSLQEMLRLLTERVDPSGNKLLSKSQYIEVTALRDAVITKALQEGNYLALRDQPVIFADQIAVSYNLKPVQIPLPLDPCKIKGKHGHREETCADADKIVSTLQSKYKDIIQCLETSLDMSVITKMVDEYIVLVNDARIKLKAIKLKHDQEHKTAYDYYHQAIKEMNEGIKALAKRDESAQFIIPSSFNLAAINADVDSWCDYLIFSKSHQNETDVFWLNILKSLPKDDTPLTAVKRQDAINGCTKYSMSKAQLGFNYYAVKSLTTLNELEPTLDLKPTISKLQFAHEGQLMGPVASALQGVITRSVASMPPSTGKTLISGAINTLQMTQIVVPNIVSLSLQGLNACLTNNKVIFVEETGIVMSEIMANLKAPHKRISGTLIYAQLGLSALQMTPIENWVPGQFKDQVQNVRYRVIKYGHAGLDILNTSIVFKLLCQTNFQHANVPTYITHILRMGIHYGAELCSNFYADEGRAIESPVYFRIVDGIETCLDAVGYSIFAMLIGGPPACITIAVLTGFASIYHIFCEDSFMRNTARAMTGTMTNIRYFNMKLQQDSISSQARKEYDRELNRCLANLTDMLNEAFSGLAYNPDHLAEANAARVLLLFHEVKKYYEINDVVRILSLTDRCTITIGGKTLTGIGYQYRIPAYLAWDVIHIRLAVLASQSCYITHFQKNHKIYLTDVMEQSPPEWQSRNKAQVINKTSLLVEHALQKYIERAHHYIRLKQKAILYLNKIVIPFDYECPPWYVLLSNESKYLAALLAYCLDVKPLSKVFFNQVPIWFISEKHITQDSPDFQMIQELRSIDGINPCSTDNNNHSTFLLLQREINDSRKGPAQMGEYWSWYFLAERYRKQDMNKARICYTRILELKIDFVEAWIRLGDMHYFNELAEGHDYKFAACCYRNAIKYSKCDPFVSGKLDYCEYLEKLEKLHAYTKALMPENFIKNNRSGLFASSSHLMPATTQLHDEPGHSETTCSIL